MLFAVFVLLVLVVGCGELPPVVFTPVSEGVLTPAPEPSPTRKIFEPTVAPGAEVILVEISPGCWIEVDSATDRRLWGYSRDQFNTTHTKPDGTVVEEVLTREEILAINPDWKSWPQRCPGDEFASASEPTRTPAPAPLIITTPTPTRTPVPVETPLPTEPPAELVTQIREDTSFVLAAAGQMRQYVGASGGDKDVCLAAEPALKFILDARAEGLLAALPQKSGFWGSESIARWSVWSTGLRAQAEQALGLTETAFGIWFQRNFAGVQLGSEIDLPKGEKTLGAEFKGVREGACVFGRWPTEKVFSPGETMQIAVRRTFNVVLLACDEKQAIVQLAVESAAGQLFEQGMLDAVLAGPAWSHPSLVDTVRFRDVVFRTGPPRLLRPASNVLIEEPNRLVIFQETKDGAIIFKVNGVSWEVPNGSVVRLTYKREVGGGLYCEQYRVVQTPDRFMIFLFSLDPGWYDGQIVHRVP